MIYVIITKFFLLLFFKNQNDGNLEILPEWTKEDIRKSLAKAASMYEKQEQKTCLWKMTVENDKIYSSD